MIKTSRQLKDLIRNLSREKAADAQLLMRKYMMERLLERVSLSQYRNQFLLKGGMLIGAMVGLDARSTMDMDATVKGANVTVEDVERMITNITNVQVDDGVSFTIKRVEEIMDDADYPGVRVSLEALFDGAIVPVKVDVSTGDAITPREVSFSFCLMFEDRSIPVQAYNLETMLAEKMETALVRSTANSRMRDFYDMHILWTLYGSTIDHRALRKALEATETVCMPLRKRTISYEKLQAAKHYSIYGKDIVKSSSTPQNCLGIV